MISGEMNDMQRKCCVLCGKPIRGRIDKKFCDDYCRNTYNNKLKGGISSNVMRNINNALKKNHRILETLLSDAENGITRANRERLVRLGFEFRYQTHTLTTREGKDYHYCYDHGYLPLDNDWYLIVKQNKQLGK